jgi:hypothetical protein
MVGTEEERMILEFLEGSPQSTFSAMEICRRAAGKRRFEQDPRWAFPFLSRLADLRLITREPTGHYRCCQSPG